MQEKTYDTKALVDGIRKGRFEVTNDGYQVEIRRDGAVYDRFLNSDLEEIIALYYEQYGAGRSFPPIED